MLFQIKTCQWRTPNTKQFCVTLLWSPNVSQLKMYTGISFASGRDISSHERSVWGTLGYEEVIANNDKSREKKVEVLSAKMEVSLKRRRDMGIEVNIGLNPVRQDLAKIMISKNYICLLFNFFFNILNCESVVTDATKLVYPSESVATWIMDSYIVSVDNRDHEHPHSLQQGPWTSTWSLVAAQTTDINTPFGGNTDRAHPDIHTARSTDRESHRGLCWKERPWTSTQPSTWPRVTAKITHMNMTPRTHMDHTYFYSFLNGPLKCYPPHFDSRTFRLITY